MNKFLSLIEKKASVGEVVRATFSPAWMENHIAQQHGKKGPTGVKENVKSHLKGALRASGRAIAEGVAGAGIGAGIGVGISALSKGKIRPHEGAMGAGVLGANVGEIHGTLKSYDNQAKEMHKKYSDHEKKAALALLMGQGYSFEKAAEAIEKEATMMGSAMAVAKTLGSGIKADAGKLTGQVKGLMSGKYALQGKRFTTPISGMGARAEAGKDMIKNKALIAGAVGGVGGGTLANAAINRSTQPSSQDKAREKMAEERCHKIVTVLKKKGLPESEAFAIANKETHKK